MPKVKKNGAKYEKINSDTIVSLQEDQITLEPDTVEKTSDKMMLLEGVRSDAEKHEKSRLGWLFTFSRKSSKPKSVKSEHDSAARPPNFY